MDTVILDGVEYVKASTLAKQFRYTADYVGQLCRGRKVDARLVGRTWFVNRESLESHKQNRHQRAQAVAPATAPSTEVEVISSSVRPIISPRLKRATLHRLAKPIGTTEDGERRLRVAYERDDETILPTLHKKHYIEPRTVHIEQVDAKRISIKGKQDSTQFVAGELPEVSLKGKLTVTDYPEALEDDVNESAETASEEIMGTRDNFENKAISEEQKSSEVVVNVQVKQELSGAPTMAPSAPVVAESRPVTQPKATRQVVAKQKRLTVTAEDPASPVATPVKVGETVPLPPLSFTPQSVAFDQPVRRRTPTVVMLSPLIATLLAAVFVILIMLASSSVVVTGSEYESHVVLQVANLLELLGR